MSDKETEHSVSEGDQEIEQPSATDTNTETTETTVESTSKPEFVAEETAADEDEHVKQPEVEDKTEEAVEAEAIGGKSAAAAKEKETSMAQLEQSETSEGVDSVKASSSAAESKVEVEKSTDHGTAASATSTSTLIESQQSKAETTASALASGEEGASPAKNTPQIELSSSATRGLSTDSTTLAAVSPSPIAEQRQPLDKRKSSDTTTSPPPPANLARKASTGLGALLGRMGTMRKAAASPPASRQDLHKHERRNTGQSTSSFDATSLNGLEGRPSLQDQFSSLRREQEYQVEPLDEDDESKEQQNKEGRPKSSSISSALKSPPLDPTLPPGTAAGLSAGPAELPREVNWDLWQQVVYEGPTAVARTSGEELSQAIASGIPAAIRGVVWQVLAESKNEGLEHIYRTLKARGTDAELRPNGSRSGSSAAVNGAVPESAISETSSVHSDQSPPTTAPATPAAVEGSGAELHQNLLAEKQKRESVILQKLEKAIRRDLGSRTSYSKYTQSAGLQDGLFGVCKAYALFDEGVGYAQGINFVAMPLLFNMSEEEAFTLLVRLMSKYDLRSLFIADMPGLHLRLYQFERLLEDYEPAVYCHLRRRNVTPQLYATQWFLTLFAYRFPLQLVLRVYDLIFSEGLTAVLKFGIVLMQRNREALLAMKDMSQLTTFLKEKIFDVYIDKSPSAASLLDSGFFGSVTGGADKELYRADEMVADACEIKISDATLAAYTAEWEESQRTERERETELETLRTSNIHLTSRVKGLEERVQQHDTEHVSMAQDLVRLKVENDALLDSNEGLKLQVTELQKLLDAQPAEVEEKLKTEMDRIMQRNIEVQNENRKLKEEMDEMEHTLVNVKMLHAQSQTDHDTLKQKLLNMQALLNDAA